MGAATAGNASTQWELLLTQIPAHAVGKLKAAQGVVLHKWLQRPELGQPAVRSHGRHQVSWVGGRDPRLGPSWPPPTVIVSWSQEPELGSEADISSWV